MTLANMIAGIPMDKIKKKKKKSIKTAGGKVRITL